MLTYLICSTIINTDNTDNTVMTGDGKVIFNGNGNVFEQIANNFIKMIKTGAIKNGEYLPSCRDLARDLGINPNTVQRAYTHLEENGYVTKVSKKGVYVSYSNENKLEDELKQDIIKYKNSGLSKEEIMNIVEEVYGGDNNAKD